MDTPLDHIVNGLRARDAAADGQDPPAAILWTDPGREWEGLLGVLRGRMPELLTLGSYDPEARTGPAIWLRCVVDGTIQPSGPHTANGSREPGEPRARTSISTCPDSSGASFGRARHARRRCGRWSSCSTAASRGTTRRQGLDGGGLPWIPLGHRARHRRGPCDPRRATRRGGGGGRAAGGPVAGPPPRRGRLQPDAIGRLPARLAALDGRSGCDTGPLGRRRVDGLPRAVRRQAGFRPRSGGRCGGGRPAGRGTRPVDGRVGPLRGGAGGVSRDRGTPSPEPPGRTRL